MAGEVNLELRVHMAAECGLYVFRQASSTATLGQLQLSGCGASDCRSSLQRMFTH